MVKNPEILSRYKDDFLQNFKWVRVIITEAWHTGEMS